jgi:TonB family protein
MGAVLGVFIAFGIVIPLLPDPPRPVPPPAPVRVAEFLLARPLPPPPPPPEPLVTTPQPTPTPVVERPVVMPQRPPQPEVRPDPRAKASRSGLLALSQQLDEIRELDVPQQAEARAVAAAAGEKGSVDRALLTARTGEGSGGVTVGAASRGFGAAATQLQGNATTRVSAPAAAPARAEPQRSGSTTQASRSREEVELVFDRNKAAIHALYARALRDRPALQGKVVLEITIAASGEVTECRVVSSELGDAELERKLVARVRMFRFESRDVATLKTVKPIEFFPA